MADKEDIQVGLLADDGKINFSALDLFDKVINLRLTVEDETGKERDTYVIRSDFEQYYPNMMNNITTNDVTAFAEDKVCIIRKCQHKPSIKVQYKRVALNTGVTVDIFIHNFYMLAKSGEMLMGFNSSKYKLKKVELAMGYFGQFQALFSEQTPVTTEALMSVGFDNIDEAKKYGITVISLSGLIYSQTDKLPPDMLLHLHGTVGNFLTTKMNIDNLDPPATYEKIMKTVRSIPSQLKGDETYLDAVYFNTITRQWIRDSAPSQAILTELVTTSSGSVTTKGTGMLTDDEAEKYGIHVYLSKGAREFSKKQYDNLIKRDEDGKIIPPALSLAQSSTAEGKMNAIENVLGLGELQHTTLDTFGDYIVFKTDELSEIEKLKSTSTIEEEYKTTEFATKWKNQIPAVYNITTDKLCTIVCPFFCFINPFETLFFKSRYALSGLVSYYANFNVEQDKFYALWQNISFATVEDVNECTIVCTGGRS